MNFGLQGHRLLQVTAASCLTPKGFLQVRDYTNENQENFTKFPQEAL
jgi:hypothetical protein